MKTARFPQGWFAFAVALSVISAPAAAQDRIVGWGSQVFDSAWPDESFVEVVAGGSHTTALRADGTLAAWGDNLFGQCAIPTPPPGERFVALTAGWYHTLARVSDGSVMAWGNDVYGQCQIPPPQPGESYVDIAGGVYHSLLLRSDGTLDARGYNNHGQCNVPALAAGTT
jgi:alpha-tubulin suppressor-like RCC1 family protein